MSNSHIGEKTYQLVLSAEFRAIVLKCMHDEFGHLGIERTSVMLRRRLFWPKISVDVDQYIRNCEKCIKRETPCQKVAPLNETVSTGPMDCFFFFL